MPCYMEEEYIGAALQSVLDQNIGSYQVEILVVDGRSTDRTRDIVSGFTQSNGNVRLLDNEMRTAPYALNIGIREARGGFIARMDVHATYPENYLLTLAKAMVELEADNAGGYFVTLPGADTAMAHAIALAIAHPFGIGDSDHRTGISETKEVDTVPYGFYRRVLFDQIGMFDEDLTRNQDDEFNARLRKAGGKIFMIAGLGIHYYARKSLDKVWDMFFQYGLFKPLVNKKIGGAASWRQLIPPLFVLGWIACLSWLVFSPLKPFLMLGLLSLSYFSVSLLISGLLAFRAKSLAVFLRLPFVFITIHFAYGLGYWKGLFKFTLGGNRRVSQLKSSR